MTSVGCYVSWFSQYRPFVWFWAYPAPPHPRLRRAAGGRTPSLQSHSQSSRIVRRYQSILITPLSASPSLRLNLSPPHTFSASHSLRLTLSPPHTLSASPSLRLKLSPPNTPSASLSLHRARGGHTPSLQFHSQSSGIVDISTTLSSFWAPQQTKNFANAQCLGIYIPSYGKHWYFIRIFIKFFFLSGAGVAVGTFNIFGIQWQLEPPFTLIVFLTLNCASMLSLARCSGGGGAGNSSSTTSSSSSGSSTPYSASSTPSWSAFRWSGGGSSSTSRPAIYRLV